ncbi:MAG: glycosyltransferase family 2 protein [Candidatus Diapherotrites archaeon]|uniref:Glycosyltransferase family 2 protein n=1 Tax=Candidatus Iainarchaeum sp. TaxID=3101447 RepID=A0A8T4LDL7_9ARCH|nr:glycosyltransferase family 2 protein [Candidatus Diapherotrites archaeon]
MPRLKKNPDFGASIVIATLNNAKTLRKTLYNLLNQDFSGDYEIIVVNDGSTDETRNMMHFEFANQTKIRFIDFQKNQGVCKSRNAGIRFARFPLVINMDHDCIAEKDWLSKMVAGFDSPEVGVVSAYDYYGGTSTGFRKELLDQVGGYDEEYRYYREDTDLSFKIMELGYKFKLVKAGYLHDHEMVKPNGLINFLKHVWQRLVYHQNDVLLYKKHPSSVCKEFLNIKWGFWIDPWFDFAVATGLWQKKGKFELSSPRGITFLKNSTPLHTILIILGGIAYVIAVKSSRLVGSIRFGKLLL